MKRFLLFALLALAAFLLYQWITFPDVGSLARNPPSTTAFMELRKEELRREGKDDTIEYQFVPYGRISPYLRRAALVAEDDAFYQHNGIDVEGLKEAARKDWKKKKFAAGGSTITQQLAKNLYLSPSRNPFRKLKELLIARSLERNLTKKRILELYLNVAEFGQRTYGAEAAARHYFGKPASALTPSEAALLAGCLPNPRIMNPASPDKRLRRRQRMILSRMKRWGYLFEREVLTEKKPAVEEAPLPTVLPPTDTDLTPPAPVSETTETSTDTSEPAATESAPSPSERPPEVEPTPQGP
jgi:monofunctional biosynthetic peptidoglycan transglycosylase